MAMPLNIVDIAMQLLLVLVQVLLQLLPDQVIAPGLLKLEVGCRQAGLCE